MKLIERRVGLLFAAFALALLRSSLVRAAWLQAVQGGDLRAEAHSQQTSRRSRSPGSAAAILDRHGKALAVSEDAATVFATPYQVENPQKAARSSAEVLDDARDRPAEAAYGRNRVRVPREEGRSRRRRDGSAGSSSRVSGSCPTRAASTRRASVGARMIGAVGDRRRRPLRDRGFRGGRCSTAPTASSPSPATRSARRSAAIRDDRRRCRRRRRADDRRQDPGRDRERARRGSARAISPIGATAIVMNPADGDVLAMASWPPVDPTDLDGGRSRAAVQPRDRASPMSRARPSRPSRSPALWRKASSSRSNASTCRRRSRSPTGRSRSRTAGGFGTLSVAEILAHSSNVGAVTIGLELGDRSASTSGSDRFGFGTPTGIDFPRRGAGNRPRFRGLLGLDDRQPADRPGPCGHADADDGRLRCDRQRRHAAHAAADRVGRRRGRHARARASR